jgi:sugar lactone lactonase YvrE
MNRQSHLRAAVAAALTTATVAAAPAGVVTALAFAPALAPAPASARPPQAPAPLAEYIGGQVSISEFKDVKETDPFYDDLRSLVERWGVSFAIAPDTFGGSGAITRGEMAAWLEAGLGRVAEVEAAAQDEYALPDPKFWARFRAIPAGGIDPQKSGVKNSAELKDMPATAPYYLAAMRLVDRYGVVPAGPDRRFRGDEPLTGAEMAALFGALGLKDVPGATARTVTRGAFASALNALLTAQMDGIASRMDAARPAIAQEYPAKLDGTTRVGAVAFSADGALAASGRVSIALWDGATGKERLRLKGCTEPVTALAFHPNGKTLVSGDAKGVLKVWDTTTGRLLRTLDGKRGEVSAVAFSPDGEVLATGSNQLEIWDAASGALAAAAPGPVDALAFSPDGATLAVGGYDALCLWDVAPLRQRSSVKKRANAVAFSADGKRLYSGAGEQGGVAAFDAATLAPAGALPADPQAKAAVRARSGRFAVSRDGATLAAADGGNLLVWSPGAFRAAVPVVAKGTVTAVALAGDGRRALIGDDRGSVYCVSVEAASPGKTVFTVPGSARP